MTEVVNELAAAYTAERLRELIEAAKHKALPHPSRAQHRQDLHR